jgi:hypothetical protein
MSDRMHVLTVPPRDRSRSAEAKRATIARRNARAAKRLASGGAR